MEDRAIGGWREFAAGRTQMKTQSAQSKIITILLGLPWVELFTETWKHSRKLLHRLSDKGIYKVLAYEMQLDLHDPKGSKASYRKRQQVRYLQNNVIAYHDQAWGDGKILLNFRCSPGKAVDCYRLGHKTLTLISLRQIRNRGEQDQLDIAWDMQNSFTRKIEEWTTSVSHKTKYLQINITFPAKRPPLKAWLIETNRQKQTELSKQHIRQLPDGRWQLAWEKHKPRQYEDYTIRWLW